MNVDVAHARQRSVAVMSSRYDDLARPPLDVADLRRALVTPETMWTRVDVVDETTSTNADLAAAAADPNAVGSVLIAEHQSAGRGRLDRKSRNQEIVSAT